MTKVIGPALKESSVSWSVALGLHAQSGAKVRRQTAYTTVTTCKKTNQTVPFLLDASWTMSQFQITSNQSVSLRTHAAYLGMRTRYQQDLIYSFLKFLLPQSLPTPTGTSCLLSFTPPHITTEPPQHAELWQEASMHLKATAIRMWQHFLNSGLQALSSWATF